MSTWAWMDTSSADRLVAHNEFGVERQGAGNSDPLSPPAVQLMGVGVDQAAGQAHHIHHFQHFFLDLVLFLGGVHTLDQQRRGDGLGDCHPRVQRGVGVLENDLHIRA